MYDIDLPQMRSFSPPPLSLDEIPATSHIHFRRISQVSRLLSIEPPLAANFVGFYDFTESYKITNLRTGLVLSCKSSIKVGCEWELYSPEHISISTNSNSSRCNLLLRKYCFPRFLAKYTIISHSKYSGPFLASARAVRSSGIAP